MTRTHVRARRLVVSLAITVIAAAWAPAGLNALASEEPRRVSRSGYVVREGDTLWSIAERVAPGEDPRPVVDALVSANRVDPGALVPGELLIIPSVP